MNKALQAILAIVALAAAGDIVKASIKAWVRCSPSTRRGAGLNLPAWRSGHAQ
jgi:hypothetical protein